MKETYIFCFHLTILQYSILPFFRWKIKLLLLCVSRLHSEVFVDVTPSANIENEKTNVRISAPDSFFVDDKIKISKITASASPRFLKEEVGRER